MANGQRVVQLGSAWPALAHWMPSKTINCINGLCTRRICKRYTWGAPLPSLCPPSPLFCPPHVPLPPPAVLILIGRHNCSAPLPIIIDPARPGRSGSGSFGSCKLPGGHHLSLLAADENEFRANLHKAANSSSLQSVVVQCPLSVVRPPSAGNWNLCKFGKHQADWEEDCMWPRFHNYGLHVCTYPSAQRVQQYSKLQVSSNQNLRRVHHKVCK